MGYASQEGHVGIRTQASKGTYADPGAVAPNQGVFIKIRSGSLGGNRELLVPDPEIGGTRDVPDALLGPVSFAGDLDLYARWEGLPTLLKGVMGAAGSTGAVATGYTHTMTTANALPWLSVEEKIANSYMVFGYTDAKVNTFHLEADASGYLMATAGLMALSQTTVTATGSGSQRWDNSPLSVGTNITVTYNSVQLPAKSFSLDITNNIEDDDFRLGSLFLGDLVPKRREITGSVTIRPEDANMWKTAMWGSSGATAPLGTTTKEDVVITITSYDDIPGSTGPAVKYSASFTMPTIVLEPFTVEPSGDDVLEHDVAFRAVRPNPANEILTAVVKNSFATVA